LGNSLTSSQKNILVKTYSIPFSVVDSNPHAIYKYFGFTSVTTLNNSNFEGANFLKNLNNPPDESDSKQYEAFDLIIDGGTSEHIYNPIIALCNYFYFLKVGGCLVQFLPVNNYIDHGIYQFSPTFFLSINDPGINLINLHFCERDLKKDKNYWDGNSHIFKEHIHGLYDGSTLANLFRFKNNNIVAVAEFNKVGGIDYKSLIFNSNQEIYRQKCKNLRTTDRSKVNKIYYKLLRYTYQGRITIF
jgi:hypothetical protein